MKLGRLLTLCAIATASANALACYTVYDASSRVLYQGLEPPAGVDLSQPLHEALAPRFPGGHMVFQQGAECRPVPYALLARPTRPDLPPNTAVMQSASSATATMGAGPGAAPARRAAPSSPLLTDLRTARALNLPYRVMSGGIVLVPAAAAARVDLPTMTVIPPAVPQQQLQSSAMGAGPASGRVDGTVITEMHNPPLTAVQRGGSLTIRRK